MNLIITLSLGSMETDHVISESCYNEVTYNKWSKYGSKSSLEIGVGGLWSTTFVSIYQNVRLGL